MSGKGLLFIVSAPSGAGKTSLCKAVLERINHNSARELKWSCSYTTRKPREGEKNGLDYFFVSDEEFERMVNNGEFAEWAMVHGHRYGTSKRYLAEAEERGIDLLLEIDCQGARQLRQKYKQGYFIFILPPGLSELEQRLRKRRTESEEIIKRRLERAKEEVEEYQFYDYIIINDDFETAVRELESIIISERARRAVKEKEIEAIIKQFRR